MQKIKQVYVIVTRTPWIRYSTINRIARNTATKFNTLARILLAILVITAAVAVPAQGDNIIFSENFDSLPPDTPLTSENLPGWNVLTQPFWTAGDTSATPLNSISGSSAERSVMFHDACGISELRFSFLQTLGIVGNGGEHTTAEIGVTVGEQYVSYYNTLSGPRINFFIGSQNLGDRRFAVNDFVNGENVTLSYWDISVSENVWYDGLIRIEADNTATFGYKLASDSQFTLSTGHTLPSSFIPTHVGIAAFGGWSGRSRLDSVTALVPEPSSLVMAGLGFFGISAFAGWRRMKR